MKLWAAALLLGLAVKVSAGETGNVKFGPCDCANNKTCWSTVLEAFSLRSRQSRGEVDGALPNRFFAGTETYALEKPDRYGNFLTVMCGPGRAACADKRGELQRRLIYASFLSSLPFGGGEGVYYHPQTWAITTEGETTVSQLRKCRPELLDELALIVVGRKT